VLEGFAAAVAEFGLPTLVRADCGGENVDVGAFMESNKGKLLGNGQELNYRQHLELSKQKLKKMF